MTVYMPPIARKKRVDDRYNPDSFRVISDDAVELHAKFEPRQYRASFEPPTPEERLFPEIECRRTRVLPKPTADYRAHNPQSKSCSFIRTDVRLLNEPVCTVRTKGTQPSQWWPARANEGTLDKGAHTQDTIYRNDFLYTKDLAPRPTYRHSANPNTIAARGIAPVTFMKDHDGMQGFYKEQLSFEHQYNSRTDPNYPIRSKRHGSFVYSKMDPKEKQKVIDYYTQMDEEYHPVVYHSARSASKRTPQKSGKEEPQAAAKLKPNSAEKQSHCASPPRQSEKTSPKASDPEMMPTASSPIEWFNPDEQTPPQPTSASAQKGTPPQSAKE